MAHLVPVTIGEDDGATVQIVSGLNAGDKVIQDPPDSLIDGEKVTVETSESNAFGAGGLYRCAPRTPPREERQEFALVILSESASGGRVEGSAVLSTAKMRRATRWLIP